MATQRPWLYVQNPILNVTDGSYRLAVRISQIHLDALKAKAGDAFFDGLIAVYEPLNNTLFDAYNRWHAQQAGQEGQTLNLNQLLDLLRNSKIKGWDVAIQNVYANDTPQYKALLPHHRSPFQNGTQTDRIGAVSSLINSIGNDAALAAVQIDAKNFLNLLKNALTTQKSSITSTKNLSRDLDGARINMSIAQYADLGALIQKYAATPENVAPYFDLLALRSGTQVIFTGDTKPQQHENIFKHTFSELTDSLKLENEGITELKFYLAAQKNDAPGANVITVAAGEVKTVTIAELGGAANTFLNVFNNDIVNKGHWTVEFE